jgi:hypothetical protein
MIEADRRHHKADHEASFRRLPLLKKARPKGIQALGESASACYYDLSASIQAYGFAGVYMDMRRNTPYGRISSFMIHS